MPQTGHGLTGTNYSVDGNGRTISSRPFPIAMTNFGLLFDWVEKGVAPGMSITMTADTGSACAAGLLAVSADRYRMLTLTTLGRAVMAGRIEDVQMLVAAADGFDEPRILGRVTERRSKFRDRSAEAVIEVDERVGRPQCLPYLLACDEVALTVEEEKQQLEWLLLKLDSDAVLAEFSRVSVDFEDAETHDAPFGGRHGAADISARRRLPSSDRTGDVAPHLVDVPMVARTTTDVRQLIRRAWTSLRQRLTVAAEETPWSALF